MEKGKISRLTDRGFGFISMPGSDKDIFFHSKELNGVAFDSLQEGDEVQFEKAMGPKGPNATNVSLVADATAAPAETTEVEEEAADETEAAVEEAEDSKEDAATEEAEAEE